MKWHAKCDKCGTYAESGTSASEYALGPTLPVGWAEVKVYIRGSMQDRLWVLCARCASDAVPQIERQCR